jgi:cytochrome P450
MVESATEFRDRWAQQEGTAIDVLSECAELTAEVLCRALFGRQLGKHYAHQIVEGFSHYQREIDQIDLMAMLGLPDWIPRYRNSGLRKSVKLMHAVLDEIIASCRASAGEGEQSVIARLLDAKDEETGKPLSHEAIRNEVAVIFMAGHETTANSLAWTWYLLSQVPEVEAKFHAELDAVLGGRPPSFDDVAKLTYTRAIFEEALRLYPPVPLLPREALQDETYRGTKIPKGSLIFVVPWILHRHKHFWDRPDYFIPERFLGESADLISKFQYVPFSIGPRICAGMAFGLTEAILCLATIGQSLRLRLKPGTDVQPVCRLTLRPGDGLPMIVSKRTGADRSASAPGLPEAAAAAQSGCPFHHA